MHELRIIASELSKIVIMEESFKELYNSEAMLWSKAVSRSMVGRLEAVDFIGVGILQSSTQSGDPCMLRTPKT